MADVTVNTSPGLPEYEKKRDWETITPGAETSTSTPVESPQGAAANTTVADASAEQVTAEQKAAALAGQRAQLDTQAKQATADEGLWQQAERDRVNRIVAPEIARLKQRTAERVAKLDAMDSPSLWGNTDNHGKVMRGIGMALGGIGDAIQKAAMVRIGHAPPSIDTVGDIVEGILNQQREHIATLKDSVVRARTGEADAASARASMLADVDLRGSAMYKRLEQLASARLAATGKTAAEIEGDKNIAAIREKKALHDSEHADKLIGHVERKIAEATTKVGGEEVNRAPTSGTGKSPTGATADQSAALAKYVDEHPNASQGDLVGVARGLGIPDAQGEVTRVAGTNSLPEKERERQTVDLEGKPVLASSPSTVGAVSEQVANTQRAAKAIDDLRAKIAEGSGVGNVVKAHVPGSELHSQTEEVVGLMAGAMGISMSDARQKLDQAIVGGSGLGMLTGDPDKNLGRLKEMVQGYGKTKVGGMSTPARENVPTPAPSGERAAPPAPAAKAPSREESIADAKKWLTSPEATANPAKRKRAYDKLKAMGVKF